MAETRVEGRRIVLEPFKERHITEAYLSWLNDAELMRYSDQRHRRHTRESCAEYARSFHGAPNHFWAMTAKTTGAYFGTMTAYVDPIHRTADLGILVGDRGHQGGGYATEAWLAVCQHLFRDGVEKVTAGTLEVNEPMRRLMRRASMVDDGRRARHCLFEGRRVDLVYGALFRPPAAGPAGRGGAR